MAYLNIQVDTDELAQFREKCFEFGRLPNNTIRELIQAFGDDRVKITPTVQQLKGKEVYHEPRK